MVVAAALAGVLFAAAPAVGVAALDRDAAVERAADRVLDRRFQRLGEQDEAGRRRREASRDARPRDADRDRRARDGGRSIERWQGGAGALSPLLSMLIWGALGVAGVLLIVWIVREIVRARRERPAAAAARAARQEATSAAQAVLDAPLDDADRLARDGRYADAIHVLLLRTLEELVRVSAPIPPALTSREILARIALVPQARDALAELVRAVEVTWFGDDVPGEADWRRCRGAFEVFVAIYRGPGPATTSAPAPAPGGGAA